MSDNSAKIGKYARFDGTNQLDKSAACLFKIVSKWSWFEDSRTYAAVKAWAIGSKRWKYKPRGKAGFKVSRTSQTFTTAQPVHLDPTGTGPAEGY